MRKGIAEILEEAGAKTTPKQKIEYLQKNNSAVLQTILKYTFDSRIKWLLPKGKPPYKPSPFLDTEGMLFQEARRLYLFVEGGNPNLTPLKRESLFIGLLESISPKDAELLCHVKDGSLPYKGINANLVRKAFPGLIDDE
jgi:hypothetical protein